MSKKLFPAVLAATLLGGNACAQTAPQAAAALASEKQRLVGTWAMQALNEGQTNVIEFKADGTLLLHAFNCLKSDRQPVQMLAYTVSDTGEVINMQLPGKTIELKVLTFSSEAMQLTTNEGNLSIRHDYVKVDEIDAVCERYPELKAEQARQTPYQSSDFVPAPNIPEHPGMDRYLGKWGFNNTVEVEIAKDPNGLFYLSPPEDGKWHALYNDVHWEGDALHFQRYTYADLPELFRYPKHKLLTPNILQPMADGNLRQDFTRDGEPYMGVLNRIER